MILFFRTPSQSVVAVEADHEFSSEDIKKLSWLLGEANVESEDQLQGFFCWPS